MIDQRERTLGRGKVEAKSLLWDIADVLPLENVGS